jgi:Flp pilus assembly protein TadB
MDFAISTPRPMPRRPPARSVQVMSTATRDHPSGSLRVSDADRDRAIAELSEHYQAGRLTTEELEDRTGRALQARTTADLAALFTDLPRRQAPVTSAAATAASPGPASPGRSWPARLPVAPVAILAVVAVLAVLGGHPFHFAWLPVVAIIVIRLLLGGRGRRRWDRRAPW